MQSLEDILFDLIETAVPASPLRAIDLLEARQQPLTLEELGTEEDRIPDDAVEMACRGAQALAIVFSREAGPLIARTHAVMTGITAGTHIVRNAGMDFRLRFRIAESAPVLAADGRRVGEAIWFETAPC